MVKEETLKDLKKVWRTIAQGHFEKILKTLVLRAKYKELRGISRLSVHLSMQA